MCSERRDLYATPGLLGEHTLPRVRARREQVTALSIISGGADVADAQCRAQRIASDARPTPHERIACPVARLGATTLARSAASTRAAAPRKSAQAADLADARACNNASNGRSCSSPSAYAGGDRVATACRLPAEANASALPRVARRSLFHRNRHSTRCASSDLLLRALRARPDRRADVGTVAKPRC